MLAIWLQPRGLPDGRGGEVRAVGFRVSDTLHDRELAAGEAVGLEKALIDTHFTGTASRIGGIGLEALAAEALERHARAYPAPHDQLLPVGGVYAWRRDGEHHMWNPETIALVQHAVRAANGNVGAALKGDAEAHAAVRASPAFEKYREYARAANEDAARRATLRGLLRFGFERD